jgi:DNA-binding phage protein
MAEVLDWRSARLADKLMTLDREQFAVEFLRRNPKYVQDYDTTQALIAAGDVPADAGLAQLARRWGLSFPPST